MTPQTVPDVVFHTRVRNDALDGPNPYEWKDVSSADLFAGKTVVLGLRSWRYSMLVTDRAIAKMFVEPGFGDEPPGVGVQVSDAETMLAYLKSVNA